jgi:hypothetical protein
VRWQLYGLAYGIDNPSQNQLSRIPAAVAFEELLEGDGFISMRFISFRSGQHLVNGVQKVGAERLESSGPALTELQEVVHEHICGAYRPGVHLVGRRRVIGLIRGCLHPRVEGEQSLSSRGVLCSTGLGHRGEVIQTRGDVFQAMRQDVTR